LSQCFSSKYGTLYVSADKLSYLTLPVTPFFVSLVTCIALLIGCLIDVWFHADRNYDNTSTLTRSHYPNLFVSIRAFPLPCTTENRTSYEYSSLQLRHRIWISRTFPFTSITDEINCVWILSLYVY
jgi:hypothetical protein